MATTTTIRKAVITEFGDATKVCIIDAAIDPPPAQHVQVSTIYSGFSGSDLNMRKGVYIMQKKAPLTPGYCLVGRVTANGEGSSLFRPGDVVGCMTVYDSEAELVNLPEKYLIKIPSGMNLQQATALLLDWATAYAMVYQSAKVLKDQRVFVHGMSGAVGYAVMKLCQLQGAEVYGTASERNHQCIIEEGGKPFIYQNKDWMKAMKDVGGAHVVFDALGFESWDESFSILAPDGMLVGYGGNLESLNETASPRSPLFPVLKLLARGMIPFWCTSTRFYYITRDDPTYLPNLSALFDLLEEGQITVRIKKIWDLEDIQVAHREYASGCTGVGSLLIRVSGE